MRVMVLMKADKNSETGQLPDEKLLAAMGKFNEELVNAGIMLAGEGLHPSSRGKRVKLSPGGKSKVMDGPFTEAKELIAGFWIWKVKSLEEAADWVLRMAEIVRDSGAEPDVESEIEIRQVFELEDFGGTCTP